MKKKAIFACVVAGTLLATVNVRAEDQSVNYAYALCKVIDGTGLTSAPCAVSGLNSSVTATIDMNAGEARQLCSQMASQIRQQGVSFSKGWTLQIKSPSSSSTIAFCNL